MTTAGELAERLVALVVAQVEAVHAAHLPRWRIPRTFAGHAVGPDVRADICFTLTHLADAGVEAIAGASVEEVLATLLAEVDGEATHTFFSYRIAETLLRRGPFDGNPLLAGLDADQQAAVVAAVDSTGWIELLDAGLLPRNYAAVLARCEQGRLALGLVDDTTVLDDLLRRVEALVADCATGMLDDSPDGAGRYDIYSADVQTFCEPLADRLGPVWERAMRASLDLVDVVGSRNGAAVPWGRSIGDLAVALTIEMAALALDRDLVEGEDRARWLRRAVDATITLEAGFADDGLTTAHVDRAQDHYRGPARRLQLTFDLLGKAAWAASLLRRTDPTLAAASIGATYRDQDRFVAFDEAGTAGAWAVRRGGVDVVVPFVGTTRSAYLAAVHSPGLFEVPVDRDLPTWTPLVVTGGRRHVGGGVPSDLRAGDGGARATWDGLPVSGIGYEREASGSALAGSVTARYAVEGRSVVIHGSVELADLPDAVSVVVPELAGRPLKVELGSSGGHAATAIDTRGLAEWRTPWGQVATVHQLDLDPARSFDWDVRATPLIRLGSTEIDHHYSQSLYRPMADRVVAGPSPVGWNAVRDPGFRQLDVLHLHWPEWLAFDDLPAHRRIIARLADHAVPVVWTAHNLTPHVKDPAAYDPIYAAWADAADAVIHHSRWGEARMRERYAFREGCRHEVIEHGHFGRLWEEAGLPDRAAAEQRLGLRPTGLRIGIVGAPRAEKLVQVVLDAVAQCTRSDVELVCWSLGPDDVVPDDPRIAIAERYEMVDRATYATRLATCDVLALVFDAEGEMLATGAAADAVGLGLPALRSAWGYLVEALGGAGLPVGQTVESVAAAIDALTPDRLAAARAAAAQRRVELDWTGLADRTVDLLERVVQRLP